MADRRQIFEGKNDSSPSSTIPTQHGRSLQASQNGCEQKWNLPLGNYTRDIVKMKLRLRYDAK